MTKVRERSKRKEHKRMIAVTNEQDQAELRILEHITGLAAKNGRVPPQLRMILLYASEMARDKQRGVTRSYVPAASFPPLMRSPVAEGDWVRWTCNISYRTHAGLLEVEHKFEELFELQELIERGPGFYVIDRIEIRPTAPSTMTLEQSLTI